MKYGLFGGEFYEKFIKKKRTEEQFLVNRASDISCILHIDLFSENF